MHQEDQPAQERKSSRLPLSEQEKCLVMLHDSISILTERLSAVLTPEQEYPSKDGGDKAVPARSPLAEQLDVNNTGILKASRKIDMLVERVEC